MIDPQVFYDELARQGITFYAGVPDSLLSSLCACIADSSIPEYHVTAANEGNAVALTAGYHLATGNVGAVYLQNSGIGNAVNPLVSLTDPEVYRIPMLLIIGWRGEPGVHDEPQHIKQGAITTSLLDVMGIPWEILDAQSCPQEVIAQAVNTISKTHAPAAILVRAKTFSSYKPHLLDSQYTLVREQVLEHILEVSDPQDVFISTTGKTSRELYEIRVRRGEESRDFLTVGSMGHSSSIALGAALHAPNRRIICLDGDGAMLMHMGSLGVIGHMKPANFIHVVLHNGVHESVGGQPIGATDIDIKSAALGCGYRSYLLAEDEAGLAAGWSQVLTLQGPVMLEVRVRIGSRDDLGRPASSPEENKKSFMRYLGTAKST